MRLIQSAALVTLATFTLAVSVSAQNYSFTVIAGLPPQSGTIDGTGSDARFSGPYTPAIDPAGNVYIADVTSHTIRKITPAGVVTTFAGLAGQLGSTDGKGAAARFNFPQSVATDTAGNVYVADYSNSTVRKITPDGTVSTFAGLAGSFGSADGTGSSARFYTPGGIAVDIDGTVYVADWIAFNIRKISPAGVVSTVAGAARTSGSLDGTGTNARFLNPSGLTLDASGNLYVADTGNATIRKITPAGIVTTVAGLAGATGTADASGSSARFNRPTGLAADSAGNIFVADSNNNSIRRISPTGVVTTFAGFNAVRGSTNATGTLATFYSPRGITIDRSGNFFVADYFNRTIRKITSAGAVTDFAGPGGTFGSVDGIGKASRFDNPRSIAVDSAENIFVADTGNNTIRKISPEGVVTTFAGRVDGYSYVNGSGGAVRLGYTEGLAINPVGNLYASDAFYNAVRLITPDGTASTFAGMPGQSGSTNGTAASALFTTPRGIALDGAGNLYVADSLNHVIRKIGTDRTVTTLAGLAGTSGSVDGVGAAARFTTPCAVTVDVAGNVYVSDTGNSTIRKITPDGTVTTLAGLAGTSGSTDGAGSAARFLTPRDLGIERSGSLLVTDTDNFSVRRVTLQGVVTTIGGLAGTLDSVDGTGANARFYLPIGLAISKSGNIYIADAGSNTVIRGEPEFPPSITRQPTSFTVSPGSTVVLSSSTTGGGLVYQWRLNGVPIPGADKPTITLTNAQSVIAGAYTLVATNSTGAVTTAPANLAISTTTDFGRITNLAIRSQAGTDAQTLIVGTVLGGAGTTGTKPLLLRGVGPTLTTFNVTGALADPVMNVFNNTGRIAGNDDWAGGFDFTSVGAFPFTGTTPKDAALYNAATALGSYSIQISGKNGTTGTALAEIYDATPGASFTATTPRLINVSARTQVGTGGDILIAGFTIGGATAKTVLIRAAGPALAAFGVTGVLADPKLELFGGPTLLIANDDWAGDPVISRVGTSVGAFPFNVPTSKDAALLVTLAPGGYTVQVSGVSTTTGVALIEIYEVP